MRFFARAIDLALCSAVIAGLAGSLSLPASRLHGLMLWMVAGAVWVFVEAVIVCRWRTTPGKWLLRSRIEVDGAAGGVGRMLDCSFAVFTLGMGCLVPVVSGVCLACGLQDLSNTGTTRWDRGRFRVVHERVGFGRAIATAGVLLVLLSFPAVWMLLG